MTAVKREPLKADQAAANRALNAACKRAVVEFRDGRCGNGVCEAVAMYRAEGFMLAAAVTAAVLLGEAR